MPQTPSERLLTHVRDAGGAARATAARRAGFSAALIAQVVATGALIRVRRVWIVLPDADPLILRAARTGVVVSCVTQARRLELWTRHAPDRVHVGAPPHAGRIDGTGLRVHRARPIILRKPDALVDPIENVLGLVASCLPFEEALTVWNSALNSRLVELHALQKYAWHGTARQVLAAATPFSDSGLETIVPERLRFLGVRILRQVWIAGHRVDFLIGERLVLQIDGGHHVGAQRTSDIRHDAQLLLLGYHVIRIGYAQVIDDWPAVQDTIMRAVAQGLHLVR